MYLLDRLNRRQHTGDLHISANIAGNNGSIGIADQKRTHVVRAQQNVDRVGFFVVHVQRCRVGAMQRIQSVQGKVQNEIVKGVQRQ